jgi:hypothetical protein
MFDPASPEGMIAIEPPRRLRLDELLRELGARDPAAPGDPQRAPRTGELAVGDIVDKAAEAGFGFLIGILALIAIPFVGLSTPFGLAIAALGFQLMIGKRRPWLPARLCKRTISLQMLDRVLALLTRRMRWLATSTRRRWELAIRPRLIGVGVVFLALGLALPLPIPGSNLVFLVPLFVYAVGLLERDGVWVMVGHLFALIDLALLVLFGATVVAVLGRIWGWL